MSGYIPDITDSWPVSDLSRGKAGDIFTRVDQGRPQVLSRRSRPAYVIISAAMYEDLISHMLRQARKTTAQQHQA